MHNINWETTPILNTLIFFLTTIGLSFIGFMAVIVRNSQKQFEKQYDQLVKLVEESQELQRSTIKVLTEIIEGVKSFKLREIEFSQIIQGCPARCKEHMDRIEKILSHLELLAEQIENDRIAIAKGKEASAHDSVEKTERRSEEWG